jgi:hypothetical protein
VKNAPDHTICGRGEEFDTMDTRASRRRVPRAVPVLWIAALLAVCCTGTALAAASHASSQAKVAGKWNGQYSGAISGSFTLHWKKHGRALTGSIKLSSPKGSYAIDGSVRPGGKIKFGAVAVGASYKGTLHGNSMSGTWTSPQGGGSWSAHKVS